MYTLQKYSRFKIINYKTIVQVFSKTNILRVINADNYLFYPYFDILLARNNLQDNLYDIRNPWRVEYTGWPTNFQCTIKKETIVYVKKIQTQCLFIRQTNELSCTWCNEVNKSKNLFEGLTKCT